MTKVKFVCLLIAVIAALPIPPAFALNEDAAEGFLEKPLGVFSWNNDDIADEDSRLAMFRILREVGVSEVYKYLDEENASPFLEQAYENDIDVYVLAGQPEWGLDIQAKSMLEEVDIVARMMAEHGEKGPSGLMLDVEPYLTRAYQKDPEGTMAQFAVAMRTAYRYANTKGVQVILCIPYFLDSKGFEDHLESLIFEAADAVAVMNYYKSNERQNIENEVELTKRAGKRIISIVELQRPGTHDLTERNTYYRDGLAAVWESFDALGEWFDYDALTFALHDFTALRKVLDRE